MAGKGKYRTFLRLRTRRVAASKALLYCNDALFLSNWVTHERITPENRFAALRPLKLILPCFTVATSSSFNA